MTLQGAAGGAPDYGQWRLFVERLVLGESRGAGPHAVPTEGGFGESALERLLDPVLGDRRHSRWIDGSPRPLQRWRRPR